MIKTILSWLTGGVLGRILDSVDKSIDNETERQQIRSEAVQSYVKTAAEVKIASMQSRAFWLVWTLFAAPLGIWWALVLADTTFSFGWKVSDLPASIKPWADIIFGSLFGSGATVGAAQAIALAIRGRK
jgi:hypothetical protein